MQPQCRLAERVQAQVRGRQERAPVEEQPLHPEPVTESLRYACQGGPERQGFAVVQQVDAVELLPAQAYDEAKSTQPFILAAPVLRVAVDP